MYTIRLAGHRSRALIFAAACACAVYVSACSSSGEPFHPTAISHSASQFIVKAQDDEVLLVPVLRVGTAGWCVIVATKELSRCSPISTAPILGEGCDAPKSASYVTEAFALTTGEVAAVSIGGGAPISTRAESVLPDGLRAVVVEIHGQAGQILPGGRYRCPSFVPLNANGRLIERSAITSMPLTVTLPVRLPWRSPAHPPRGVCEISAAHLPGLSARNGEVATRIRSYPGLVGRAFVSCVNLVYNLYVPRGEETSLRASVLLDAAHPGTTPAPLPGMKPLPGHPGVFNAPNWGGEMVARRIPGAWLVAGEAKQEESGALQHSLRLLEHLSATVHL
jgi:hypothetical protein